MCVPIYQALCITIEHRVGDPIEIYSVHPEFNTRNAEHRIVKFGDRETIDISHAQYDTVYLFADYVSDVPGRSYVAISLAQYQVDDTIHVTTRGISRRQLQYTVAK